MSVFVATICAVVFFNAFMYVVGELVSVERCQFGQIEGIGPTLDSQVPAIFIVSC